MLEIKIISKIFFSLSFHLATVIWFNHRGVEATTGEMCMGKLIPQIIFYSPTLAQLVEQETNFRVMGSIPTLGK